MLSMMGVNANTSILGRQYTMTVTFELGSHFEQKMSSKCHKMASY